MELIGETPTEQDKDKIVEISEDDMKHLAEFMGVTVISPHHLVHFDHGPELFFDIFPNTTIH